LARRIARRLRARPGRRWKHAPRGDQISLRRTMREAMKTGGEISTLTYRERKLRRTRLVVLADVSGSMDLYARLLLQFLYALQNAFASVETFVFATRLNRVTDELRAPGYREALGGLSARVQDWSGGTRIGESLAAFLEGWPRLVDRRTVVVVLSDGWETGNPEVLGQALATLRRRAGRLVWLNPLLGSPGYEPLTKGMQAALPHLDVFAPANDLASLEHLARHLSL
ncbi:MAG TPA: VWA domain-containing protein, partial [Myxococcaceae bacterium]|nr:VWA domain-containing protein [Myxococcaceae bacterium]